MGVLWHARVFFLLVADEHRSATVTIFTRFVESLVGDLVRRSNCAKASSGNRGERVHRTLWWSSECAFCRDRFGACRSRLLRGNTNVYLISEERVRFALNNSQCLTLHQGSHVLAAGIRRGSKLFSRRYRRTQRRNLDSRLLALYFTRARCRLACARVAEGFGAAGAGGRECARLPGEALRQV
jgi:hypothetical protein